MLRVALACLVASAASPALAQDIDYLDDRSSPSALVRSLYNAINRGEYARAWSYFAEGPAESVEAYAEGYENTDRIEVIVGTAHEEGAAGSLYFEVPVALEAIAEDGSSTVFAGCYTLRMADPTVGEEFEPLHIERGSLQTTDAALDAALPPTCNGGAELPEYDPALEKAEAIYRNLDVCNAARMPWRTREELAPEVFSIGFRYPFDADDQPEREAKLYRYLCYTAAYNQGHVYFMTDGDGMLSPLHFARPALDIRYADDGEETLDSVTVIGSSTYEVLVNSEYDPETRTLTARSNWRGMGDASSSGKWIFREGRFDLVHYEVDPTYDTQVNPQVVIDYDEAP